MKLRRLSVLAGVLASPAPFALAQSPPKSDPSPLSSTSASGTGAVPAPDPVIEWNRALLRVVRTNVPVALQPPTIHGTRAFAIPDADRGDARRRHARPAPA
jgi:hypothetical protein